MDSQKEMAERRGIPWWFWVIGIDLFLVAVTVLKQHPVVYPGKQWLGRHFNLAVEMNAAVWWSSISLLAVALLAYELYSRSEERTRYAWLCLSIALAALSLDETGSIHERITAGDDRGWFELLPYGLGMLSLVTYAVIFLFRNEKTRRAALYIAAAFFLFGTVPLQEHLEHNLAWPSWALGLRTGSEEGCELAGILLLCWGIAPLRAGREARSLRTIVPDPFALRHLPAIILGGGIIHLAASLVLPGAFDVTQQGNPLVWYPVTVFFLLFTAFFWRPVIFPAEEVKTWRFLSPFFLLASVAYHDDPPRLLPVIGGLVPVEYLPTLFFFTVAAVLLPVSAVLRGARRLPFLYLLVLLLLPLATLLDRSLEMQFFVAGFLAFLVFHFFWRQSLTFGVGAVKWKGNSSIRGRGQESS